MKTIWNDGVMNKCLYRIVFIVAAMLCTVPYLQQVLGKYMKILLVWGFVIIVADLITGWRRVFKHKTTICLLAFMLLYLVTILTMRKYNFSVNLKEWIYLPVVFLVLFRVDGRSRKKVKKEMKNIAVTVIICTAVLSFVCMLTYWMGIEDSYKCAGETVYIGMHQGRLWGLYNPNVGAALSVFSIVLSAFMITSRRTKTAGILCGLNIVLQYFVLILSASRTVQYGTLICICGLAFGMIPLLRRELSGMQPKNVILRAACALLVTLVALGAVKSSSDLLAHMPRVDTHKIWVEDTAKKAKSNTSAKTASSGKKSSVGRTDTDTEAGGVLNGRQYLWHAAGTVIASHPVFGVGYENIYMFGKDAVGNAKYVKVLKNAGLHNGYLTLLSASGILGTIPMVAFLVLLLWKLLKKVSTIRVLRGNDWFIAATFITVLFLIIELFEARIFYVISANMVLFWVICGYALRLSYLRVPGVMPALEESKGK